MENKDAVSIGVNVRIADKSLIFLSISLLVPLVVFALMLRYLPKLK